MARRGIELEAKFAPAGEGTLAALRAREAFPGWWIVGRHDEAQHNTYYDTPDALLEAGRCSLRRRILDGGNAGVEWTFKRGRGPGRDGVARRREVNALLPGKRIDLPRARCEPVARALRVAGAQPLAPLFTLLTTRHQIDLARDDGARLALALDRVQLEAAPEYREAEIEIELLDGDEHAIADLALWLMRTYGLLPMRGSKRGRALSWLRGEGLPVLAPALALDLLAERAGALADAPDGGAPTIAFASPRGSGQALALATALAGRLPGATIVPAVPADPPEPAGAGPLLVVGADALAGERASLGVWVKVGLPQPLLAGLIAAAAGQLDAWTILRRCGEYVVPSQRRFMDPAARRADLVVIDNAPPPAGPGLHDTPDRQVKLYGWPADTALAAAGAVHLDTATERDHFFRPPGAVGDVAAEDVAAGAIRVRLREDTAWVSLLAPDTMPQVATYEARPRVLTLLRNLGYTECGQLAKERRRYRLGACEIALDYVAALGYFCELRHLGPPGTVDADTALRAIAGHLGLAGARSTTAPYRDLLAVLPDLDAPSVAPADTAPTAPATDAKSAG